MEVMSNLPRDVKCQKSKDLTPYVTVLMGHGYRDVKLAGLKDHMYLPNVTFWHAYLITLTCHVFHGIWCSRDFMLRLTTYDVEEKMNTYLSCAQLPFTYN